MNLLAALDALLAEGSVTGAARRLGLSASAMSRTLARLRSATGDPLLVRAGRGLAPTPRALALRDRVHDLTRDVRAVLTPDVSRLDSPRSHGPLPFAPTKGSSPCSPPPSWPPSPGSPPMSACASRPSRTGTRSCCATARSISRSGRPGPRPRRRARGFCSVTASSAPSAPAILCSRGRSRRDRYVAYGHVVASRRGDFAGPVDDALQALGLRREVVVVAPGFPDALRIARDTDLVALVPRSCLAAGPSDPDPIGEGLRASTFPSARRRSWCRRCGIPAWTPTRRIAGCATR